MRKYNHLHNYFDTADEALHACIRDNDLQQLQQLLHASPTPNVNYFEAGFGPPVHFAAWCGNLDAVELLLAAGANPHLVSHGELKLTAIGIATCKGHRNIVKRLWMVCPPETFTHGFKPYRISLVVAATYGHADIVEDLLGWWNNWSQDLKTEALLWATRRWHFEVVNLLLKKAVFKQATIQEALHLAVNDKFMLYHEVNNKYEGIHYLNQQLLVALLIDAGADPNSCLDKRPPVYSVAFDANLTGVLKTLLEKGADPNKTNEAGKTALHVLAEPVGINQARPELLNETAIRLLLQHKASVSQPDNAGECPLHWAAYGLDLRLFRLYLNSDPDRGLEALLQLTSHNQETLLHFAAAGCHIEVMEFLIGQGLDVNAKNSNGWTPIMCAMVPIKRNPSLSVKSPTEAMKAAQCLLSHGADANITTDEGWTLLHGLTLYCDPDVSSKVAEFTRDLVSRGANMEARARLLSPDAKVVVPSRGIPWGYRLRDAMADPSALRMVVRPGLTPIYWAAERGAIGVIRTLLAYSVNVSLTDIDRISPTRMAAESKFLERQSELIDDMIKLLLAAGAGF